MALFSAGDLSQFLQYQVSKEAAAIAERVAAGWLKSATGVEQWPEQLPVEVFSWAIELGAIAHENPGGLSSKTVNNRTSQWALGKRSEILAAAAAYTRGGVANLGGPQGRFPPPTPWPDPAGARGY